MGNILAVRCEPVQAPPLTAVPPPTAPEASVAAPTTSGATLDDVKTEDNNPGTIEELHKKCKGLYGFKA